MLDPERDHEPKIDARAVRIRERAGRKGPAVRRSRLDAKKKRKAE